MSTCTPKDRYNNFPDAWKDGKKTYNKQPPAPLRQQPQRIPQYSSQQIDPITENRLLKADLDVAIAYIKHLGGHWPPPS